MAGYTASAATDTSQAPALPAALAQWVIPASSMGAGPNISDSAAQDAEAVEKLAQFFHLTDKPNGPDMETQVIQALASHFGLQVETPGSIGTKKVSGGVGGSTTRAGAIGEKPVTTEEPTSTNPSELPNVKALQEIAQKAKVDNPTLAGIAEAVTGDSSGGSIPGPSTGSGTTAGQEYSNFVKGLSNTVAKSWYPGGPSETFKAYVTGWLEAGNFLNASANGGTPDNATIATAYSNLLQAAQQSNTSVQDAYKANQTTAVETPSGAPPTQAISETASFVQGMGEKLGVYLSPADITKISNMYQADVTNAGGPTTVEDEIKNTVIQYFNPNDPRNPPGAASDMYQQVLQAAQNYGVPVASADIMKWVTDGITNSAGDSYSIAQAATDTAAAATSHYQQLAAGLYPSLSPQINAGQSVTTLVAPYNSITAQYTGVDPASLTDPGSATGGPTGKYFAFLQGGKDPKTGQPTMMTMDQWKKQLMSDPQYGFQNTTAGKNMASQFTSALLNEFGRVNTGGGSTPFSGYSPNPGSANTA